MRPRTQNPSRLLARIRSHNLTEYSDSELRAAAQHLQSRAVAGTADDLLPECYAIVAEAIDRRLGVWRLFESSATTDLGGKDAPFVAETISDVATQRRYRRTGDILLPADFYQAVRRQDSHNRLRFRPTDEQVLAGIHLYRGRVVQMDAGEGKTVAIAFAAALRAIVGRRVHVITANEYLADRDSALLEPVYRSLGLSSGALLGYMEAGERRHVYGRSIIYGAMRELGFDYLRDNLKSDTTEFVQQPFDVAIIDEADHALIDEAFTPIIISGNPVGSTRSAVRVNAAVEDMVAVQFAIARELAEGLDASNSQSDDHIRLLATLSLAEPDNPWLQQHYATHPRAMPRIRALADDEHDTLITGLCYAINPDKRYVTLTDRGREYLEHLLGPIFDIPAPDRAMLLTEGRKRPGDEGVNARRNDAVPNATDCQTRSPRR